MSPGNAAPRPSGTRGRTTIRPRVVETLARAAVGEPGHWWNQKVTALRARAVTDQRTAEVRLEVQAAHPIAARNVGADLRQHVTQRTSELSGLTVRRVEVIVVPVAPPRPVRVR